MDGRVKRKGDWSRIKVSTEKAAPLGKSGGKHTSPAPLQIGQRNGGAESQTTAPVRRLRLRTRATTLPLI